MPLNPYWSLPSEIAIGGYLKDIPIWEAQKIDDEGRALLFELGGFVLITTYCPSGTAHPSTTTHPP